MGIHNRWIKHGTDEVYLANSEDEARPSRRDTRGQDKGYGHPARQLPPFLPKYEITFITLEMERCPECENPLEACSNEAELGIA